MAAWLSLWTTLECRAGTRKMATGNLVGYNCMIVTASLYGFLHKNLYLKFCQFKT